MTVQWYPGHMTKTRRMMEAHMKLVDLVIELLDARVPLSSKNPDLETLTKNKPRLIILTKADMADAKQTARWEDHFRRSGFFTLALDLKAGKQKNMTARVTALVQQIMAEKLESKRKKGRLSAPIRAMVAGIPNVGKSTFINLLAGKAVTATADKPGVTRGRQWINVRTAHKQTPGKLGDIPFAGFDLMDTPGVLWPKFEDPDVGLRLAVTGAVSDLILDRITLAEHLIMMLGDAAPEAINARYRLPAADESVNTKNPRDILTGVGEARGFKMKGGAIDLERTAIMLLDEFRGGKLGRITLELP
ncbi:MAG: ribosome biogenesis GTPase YlqF [Defluviitaleaceae bacterium]|nr:ribosome biogenesis GTPase YlqF [Defluviitaleaceae bacterium]